MRAPRAGRHDARDGVQRRSGRAGAQPSSARASNICTSSISTAPSPAAAECRARSRRSSRGANPGAARRRHSRHAHHRGWLDKGVAASSSAPRRSAIPALVREAARLYPGRIAVGIDAATAWSRSRAGRETTRMSALGSRPQFRGRRRRRHHLHRHRARRRAEGPQYRGDAGTRRRHCRSR